MTSGKRGLATILFIKKKRLLPTSEAITTFSLKIVFTCSRREDGVLVQLVIKLNSAPGQSWGERGKFCIQPFPEDVGRIGRHYTNIQPITTQNHM
jgi:hypothetical protein